MNQRDELMIQKCLDDELSTDETRQLLSSLDGVSDGWKTLACGFVEERLWRKAICGGENVTESKEAAFGQPSISGPRTAGTPYQYQSSAASVQTSGMGSGRPSANFRSGKNFVRHWWSHPVTSLTLCAAIAFVAGLLIPEQDHGSQLARQGNEDGLRSQTDSVLNPASTFAPVDSDPGYKVEFVGDGTGTREVMKIPVPVLGESDAQRLSESMLKGRRNVDELLRAHPQLQSWMQKGGMRFVRIPADDQKDVLILLDEHHFVAPVQ